MTRLRFVLADTGKVHEDAIKALPEVQGIVNKAGQYQLVIGPEVDSLYDQINLLCPMKDIDEKTVEKESKEEKKSLFNTVLSYVSGSIAPALSVLITAGFTSAFLTLFVQFGWLSKDVYKRQLQLLLLML